MNTDEVRKRFEKALTDIIGRPTGNRGEDHKLWLTRGELLTLYQQGIKDSEAVIKRLLQKQELLESGFGLAILHLERGSPKSAYEALSKFNKKIDEALKETSISNKG